MKEKKEELTIEEIDFDFNQIKEEEKEKLKTEEQFYYGFDKNYKEYFKNYNSGFLLEILSNLNPENTTIEEIKDFRIKSEIEKFSPEQYM
jgi:spore coat protein CotH